MDNGLFARMGIDASYVIIVLFIMIIALFFLITRINMKYERLRKSYMSFMKGKDGKSLERSLLERFNAMEGAIEMSKENRHEIRELSKRISKNYQKVGIVKYDAFHEMGGKLSFALTMLDYNNNGWIINAMHSREGCYTYIKEIVKGESYIELAEEEAESLERAIFQEKYGLKEDIEAE